MYLKVPGFVLLAIFGSIILMGQITDPFVRHPSISPDGKTLAFSFQGDIWTVPSSGGRGFRLTVNEAYESRPLWRNDGQMLAFNSDRYGNTDIFTIHPEGSVPQRLTYHSRPDTLSGWTPDGHLLFNTTRDVPFNWEPEIYSVSEKGGTPVRITSALGEMPQMSPDGSRIAFVRGATKEERKRYRGPANLEIWVWHRPSNTYHQITTFDGNDFSPRWRGNDALVFISEKDGTYNLHQFAVSGKGQLEGTSTQLTTFKEDGVRYFNLSENGTIVFEKDTGIYLRDPKGSITKVSISVPGDPRFLDETAETFTSNVSEIAVSPNEDYLSLIVRGEVFLTKNDPEKARTMRLTDHPFRERDIHWLGENALLFSSDRMGGQYDLFLLTSADKEQPALHRTLSYQTTRLTTTEEDERSPKVSPDGKKVLFTRGNKQLIVADLKEDHTLGKEHVLTEGWNLPEDITWSPDSQWLAYSQSNLQFNSEIFIHAVDGSRKPVNISYHPRVDYAPVWSPDGSKLGFLSARNNGDFDAWFVWLRRADWEKTKEDWEEDADSDPKKPDSKDPSSTKDDTKETVANDPPKLVIDFDGIHERLQQVTSLPGNESQLAISKDGATFYFMTNDDGRQSFEADTDVYQIKWDGTEMKEVTKGGKSGGTLVMGPAFKFLYFVQNRGQLSRIDLAKAKKEGLRYQAKMVVNHAGERQQMFNEAWRALYLNFYDPNFHGVDWVAMRDKYKAWAMKASTNQDFQDVVNMMLGELNASHMGMSNPDRYETEDDTTGLLGIEVVPVNDGVRITSVLPNGPAARESSTLAAGDIITHVNDIALEASTNLYALLNGKANERVRLTVRNDKGVVRKLAIRPSNSTRNQTYDAFVDSRRKMVAEYSQDRLGYVHVRGMNWSSFEAFERALTFEGDGKEGLVIDVRYNGGGWTTDYLLSVLSVQQHSFTIPRGATNNLERDKDRFQNHYPFGERLPMSGWPGPAITLCNQFSYSNAEIFSHAFQALGRGSLIGQATFGAVISTGGVGLLGGGSVRMPFRGWFVKKTGKNMENGPAIPDQIVQDPPGALLSGSDPQLKVAVETLMKQIDDK